MEEMLKSILRKLSNALKGLKKISNDVDTIKAAFSKDLQNQNIEYSFLRCIPQTLF